MHTLYAFVLLLYVEIQKLLYIKNSFVFKLFVKNFCYLMVHGFVFPTIILLEIA